MQAVLENDAEDLKDTDFFFVVGVRILPMQIFHLPWPLQQSLLDFMQAASRRDEMDGRYPML